jgi:hypothetical protein
MSPPIDIDGSEIQRATIDGEDVSEITIDGQQTAGFVNLPDSAVLHLDASSLLLSDGQSVSTWPDLINNGDFVSDTSTASEPVFRSNQKNGKPAIEFADSFLTGSRNNVKEVFFVVNNPTSGNNPQGGGENLAGQEPNHIRTRFNSPLNGYDTDFPQEDFGGGGQYRVNGDTTDNYTDGQYHILNIVSTSSDTLSDLGLDLKRTNKRGFSGFVAEMTWFDTELTTTERDGEKQRLADKYAISVV